MLRALAIRRIVVVALAAGLSFCIAGSSVATAAPTLAQEEQQGEGIAESVRAGDRQCADLSADEFELVGEYAMGSYLGSEATHSAMNRRMTLAMGDAGERRMHMALGYRYSGCSGGPSSGWVGPMAGMMSGHGTDGNGARMMGGGEYEERGSYAGSMMGFSGHGDSGIGALGVVLIALAAAAVGAGVAALSMRRRQPREGATP
jgi:hypothetical protein